MSGPQEHAAFPCIGVTPGSLHDEPGLTKLEWAAVTIAAEMHAQDRRWHDPAERDELAERAVVTAKAVLNRCRW